MDSGHEDRLTRSSDSVTFDPICGMWLRVEQVAAQCSYLGQNYGFCCEECRALFVRAPDVYVVSLAHDPGQSAGHRCPFQRPKED